MATTLKINGKKISVDAAEGTPLLWVLRDHLKMTVHLDGNPVRSCQLPHDRLGEVAITTIEGNEGKAATAIREAWIAADVPQCGYCQSGQIMSATALIAQNASPSDEDIDAAMNGNLCRCATYLSIRRGIKDAAKSLA